MDPLSITVITDTDRLDKCLSEIFEYDVNEISESLQRITLKMPVKFEALKIAFDAQSAFMSELNNRMSSNEDAIKAVRQRLIVSTNVKEELDLRMENDTKKIKECMRHLTNLRKETRAINSENDMLIEKKKSLLESTTTLHSEIHKLHVYAKALNKRRSLADGRISYLHDMIANLSTTEDDLNNKIMEKERNIESFKQRLRDAEIAFDKSRVSATEAQERAAIATKQMSALSTVAMKLESDLLAAQESLRNAEEEYVIAQEKACAAQETTRIAEDNVVSYEQRVVAATECLSSMKKHVLALQKKTSAAEKRAFELEKKITELSEYISVVPDKMAHIDSKHSVISRLDEIISAQENIIISRERQLKMNLHTIIHRDKDLIRSQNVISHLHQEISEIEMDIALANEYAHKKRLSILNHTIKEIS